LNAGEGIMISSPNFNVNKNGKTEITDGTLNIKSSGTNIIVLEDTLNNNKMEFKGDTITFKDTNNSAYYGNLETTGLHFHGPTYSSAYLQEQMYINKTNGGSLQIDTTEIKLEKNSYNYSELFNDGVLNLYDGASYTIVSANSGVIHSSKEDYKKDIVEQKNNLSLIKDTTIYSFLYKGEDENNKKHIGLVIGEKYNTPKEVITEDGNAINLNDMCGVMWGAIKEQQEIIEDLQRRIEKLERNDK